jgi:hypothetical protein
MHEGSSGEQVLVADEQGGTDAHVDPPIRVDPDGGL